MNSKIISFRNFKEIKKKPTKKTIETKKIRKTSSRTSGTKEWASSNINIQQGCKNGCKYCYAARMAIRFKRCENLKDWTSNIQTYENNITKNYRKRNGRIMFPTTHDIYINNLVNCLEVLNTLLRAGNEILITTKPDLYCIKEICDELYQYKKQIQFRFTIGSKNDDVLNTWEPNAPDFCERISSLKCAFWNGFKTSISIEPYLDSNPQGVIEIVEPFVTETIWLGVMNSRNLPKEGRELYENQKKLYSREFLERILEKCYSLANGKLRLKDSVRYILGMN